MRRKMAVLLLLALLVAGLCGCGSVFDKEYVVVSPYPPASASHSEEEHISVSDLNGLRREILRLVNDGSTDGRVRFDAAYEGDPSEDLASACWQARTQNAVCAYCVENISYELSRVLTYDEAVVHISYAESAVPMEEIYSLSYFVGAHELVKQAMEEGAERIVIAISNSSYSESEMEEAVLGVYRQYPIICLTEPEIKVNMYSGTANQKLYEIVFDYKLDTEAAAEGKERLAALDIWAEVDADKLTTAEKALFACAYLANGCEYAAEGNLRAAYDAMIGKKADSEGLSLAYVELCRQAGIKCSVVYGQRDWQDHCWNIIEMEDACYHVDVSACITEGVEKGFLRSDESMWQRYRWDTSSCSPCTGLMNYADVVGENGAEQALPEKPEEAEEKQ